MSNRTMSASGEVAVNQGGEVVNLADRDPRQGQWHAAFAACSQCLWHAAAVWPDSGVLDCPECLSSFVAAFKDPPGAGELMRSLVALRRLANSGSAFDHCPHCARDIVEILGEPGWYHEEDGGPFSSPGGFIQEGWSEGIQECDGCGMKHRRQM